MRWTIGIIALLPLSGCYTYAPVGYDRLQPPANVTIELTSNGAVKYEPLLGAKVEGVEGSVMSLNPDSMQLGIRKVSYRGGQSQAWSGEVLGFQKGMFDNIRQRRISVVRSAALAAGIGTVFALIAQANIFGFGGNSEEPTPNPRPNPGGA